MASIERQHWYRNTYLKSDHWNSLRLRKLAKQHGKCKVCMKEAWNNDVHHLNYRNLYDVRLNDLVVLCRPCHTLVHVTLEKCQKINDTWSSRARWHRTIKAIRSKQKQSQWIENNRLYSLALKEIKRWRREMIYAGLLIKGVKYSIPEKFVKKVRSGRVQLSLEEMRSRLIADVVYPCGDH